MKRKKICKIITGSHLYGLDNAQSDRDYSGIYLPSRDDILGLEVYPIELVENNKTSSGPRNESGDVDCKYFSLRQFMRLAAEGQSAQLEMLYARPEHHAIEPSEEWQALVAQRHIFLSRSTFLPFVRFALAQATKATLKGDNLKFIRQLLAYLDGLPQAKLHEEIRSDLRAEGSDYFLGPVKLEISANEFGATLLTLAHRKYDVGASLKRLQDSLRKLEGKYGTRSQTAARDGIDYKSLSHAYRMIFEAEEILSTGQLTLPLAPAVRDFVREIKERRIPASLHWETDIIERVNHLEHTLAPRSRLPAEPDWKSITALHQELLLRQLKD